VILLLSSWARQLKRVKTTILVGQDAEINHQCNAMTNAAHHAKSPVTDPQLLAVVSVPKAEGKTFTICVVYKLVRALLLNVHLRGGICATPALKIDWEHRETISSHVASSHAWGSMPSTRWLLVWWKELTFSNECPKRQRLQLWQGPKSRVARHAT
jgi:hypothetical protein